MYFDLFNPVSQRLKEMLEKGNPDFFDVILEDSSLRAVQRENQSVINYFSRHPSELVRASLDFSIPDVANRAFAIIASNQESIIFSFVECNILAESGRELLSAPSNPTRDVQLNRFASITKMVCLTAPEIALTKCGYIFELLKYSYLPSIAELFRTILSQDNGKAVQLQTFLAEDKFSTKIFRVLSSISFTDQNSQQFEAASLLFKLIPLFKKSQALRKSVLTTEALQYLMVHVPPDCLFLLNSQWAAIASIICQENASIFAENIPATIQLILTATTSQSYHQCHTFAMKAITKTIKFIDISSVLISCQFPDQLVSLLHIFPKNTFFHQDVWHFLQNAALRPTIATELIPKLLEFCGTVANESLEWRAFCWKIVQIITSFQNEEHIKRILEQPLSNELDHLYRRVSDLVQTPYGGDIPSISSADNDDGNSGFTQDQLLQLLAFLTHQHL